MLPPEHGRIRALKWRIVAASLVIALLSGVFAYRTVSCSSWQTEYKKFLFVEMMKNSPIIWRPDDIEAIVGERPAGCARPKQLTDEDFRRFREEGVGPNHFLDRMRTST